MRVVFFGDSHLNFLIKSKRENEIFFACQSHVQKNLGMLEVQGKSLVAINEELKVAIKNSSGFTRIDLLDNDVVVLVGLRSEFPYKTLESTAYSKGVMRQAMIDIIKNQSILLQVGLKIRKISNNIRIIVVPNPLISTHLKKMKINTAPGILPEERFGKITKWPDDIYPLWKAALKEALVDINPEICFQDDAMIQDQIFSRPEFVVSDKSAPGIRHMKTPYWNHMRDNVYAMVNKS